MNERIIVPNFIEQVAREVLNGDRVEDDYAPIAKINFLNTVRMVLDYEAQQFGSLVHEGRISILAPHLDITPPIEQFVSTAIQIRKRPIALLNTPIWTDPSFFDQQLVRAEAIRRIYPATRKTVYQLLKLA